MTKDLKPLPDVKLNTKSHSRKTHNFHKRRYGNCLYCKNGFEITPEKVGNPNRSKLK